jgi:YD repeat-containing protein
MATPVFNQNPTVQNRPMGRKDAQSNLIPGSFTDLAFQGAYTSTFLTYRGYARPGASVDNPVWQIAKLTYDMSNNLTSITWPQDTNGNASSDYQFVWSSRTGYTYS